MEKYRDIIERINYGLFLVFVALLPFPQICLRYAIGLWLFTWLLEGRWVKKPDCRLSIIDCRLIPFLLFGLWFVWKAVSGLWATDMGAWSQQIERYLSFILLVPVGLWGVNKRYEWKTAGKVLVVSCVVAVPAYLGWMTLLFYHPEIVPHLHLTEEWIQHSEWWTFVPENISHFKHRLFLCSVELFGAVVACQIYRKRWTVLVPVLAVILSSIPLTGSRQAILSAAALGMVGILYALPKGHRLYYGLAVVAVGVVAGIGLLSLHPRMQQFEWRDITEMRSMSYEHDIRFNIWGAALQRPKDYIAYGLGAGQSRAYLTERYRDAGFTHYAEVQYHPHNQYLEELIEIGLGGLLLFVLAWVSVPLCAQKKGRRTAVLFTTLFMLNMFTDCMFGRFCGIALWAVGLVFTLLQSDTECDEESSGDTETH